MLKSKHCSTNRSTSAWSQCSQMNQEKDQELSVARLRVQELEALAASRQKEVCMLQTRLATTESMTRDVIRDLLGNLIDQNEIVKLVEEAHQQREELFAKVL
ncbi:Kinesin-like protein KIN-12E, variant 2 [Trifolium repens]|nr:Kinesin-like protein KIN-12E, variant 2 [Trifolium repens]